MEIPSYIDSVTGEYREGPFFRTGFNYDRDEASHWSGLSCKDPSLAQQHFAEDADINTIVRRFGITGQLPENASYPTYGDFTGISDYRTAIEAVRAAEAQFMAMPAHVRASFENDPQAFVEFCSDPVNLPAMREMGLAITPTQTPSSAPTTPPAQSST